MGRKKTAVFTNPNAGKNTPRAGLGRVIASILTTPYWHYDTRTLEELEEKAQHLPLARPDYIVIVGGDGTIHQTLTRILREYQAAGTVLPKIMVIPTGTMNNVATTLGLTRMPAKRLASLIAAKIEANVPLDHVHLNPLKVNDEYGFLYGSGLVVNFLQKYYEDHENRGPKRAVKVVLGALGNEIMAKLTFRKSTHGLLKPVHAKITLDGHEQPVAPFMTHTAILVGTVDQVGIGCRALPDARSQPGRFMLRSSALSFWGLMANLGALFAGFPLAAKTFDAVVPRLTVEYQEPTVTQLDGDLKEPRLVDVIECGPTLSFITG